MGWSPFCPMGRLGDLRGKPSRSCAPGNIARRLLLVTSRVAKVIADDAGVQLTNLQPEAPVERDNQRGRGMSAGGVILLIIVILIILFTPLRERAFLDALFRYVWRRRIRRRRLEWRWIRWWGRIRRWRLWWIWRGRYVWRRWV